jgi:putative FmdB family regulatory protein
MPVYEYKCQECGKVSEYKMSVQSDRIPACAGCGSSSMKRLISVPNIATRKSEAPQMRCCGQNEACSEQKHCCGHDAG